MSRAPLLIFCVLTIRKHLLKMRFERSGRGQEPSRGHKFSILENILSIRDFTSAMRLHFRSDLVGVALVGATPLHLLSQTALPLKSPTGAFIATQTRSCRKVQSGEDLFPMEIFTAPQHTRFILPLTSPDKIIAALRGRYFSFSRIKSYVVVRISKIHF